MKRSKHYAANRKLVLAGAVRCTWCGKEISDLLPMGHPQKATADHVTPLVCGGTDELDNLVPSCSRCNGRKGPRPASVLLPPSGRSRDW